MKKNLLLLPCLLLFHAINGQILSRTEVWPDPNWTFSGAFTPAALLMNPTTTDSQFKYDTSLVTPPGGPTDLFLSSPTIDLKPAFDGGEKALEISFDIAFQTFSIDILGLDYWDADAGSWILEGSADIETLGDFQTCTLVNVSLFLDISGFTTNQLQNFRYRFFIEDPGGQITGVCMAAPTLVSFSCPAPSNLVATNINITDATIDWVANGTETFWKIEYGLQGFTLGTGTIEQASFHPWNISSLSPGTTYDVYVSADCSGGDGEIFSNAAGPLTFTTASCIDPSNLFASFINEHDATINWTANGSESLWKIEYGLQGFALGTGTTIQSNSNPRNINSLSSGTYDVYVTAVCSGDGTVLSNAVGPLTFTTACLEPFNLFASNINTTGATIDWASNGSESLWKIEYGLQGFALGTGITIQSNSHPININSLSPSTFYDVYVTADCSGDGTVLSNVAGPLNFTTACLAPSNLFASNINATDATINWVSNGSESLWRIERGPQGFTLGTGFITQANSQPWTINTLDPGTVYDVYVTADCFGEGTSLSSATGPLTFTTQTSCPAPSNLFASNINATDATINWVINGSESFWNIEFGPQGFTLGTGVIIPANSQPWTINTLNPGTVYDVYVSADCDSGIGSDPSIAVGPLTFTTATLSLEEFSIDKLKIAPNPTHGLLELNINGANIYEVSLFSLTGQRLYDEKFNQSRVNLDLTSFKTGLYFLKILTDKGTGVYKVIKD